MASSLSLPSATSLAGNWLIEHDKKNCVVALTHLSFPGTNGYQLSKVSHDCGDVIVAEAVAWRPEPDGIALLNAKGATLMFFAGYEPHFRFDDNAKGIFILSRK